MENPQIGERVEVRLRVSRALHAQIVEAAESAGVPLASYAATLLGMAVHATSPESIGAALRLGKMIEERPFKDAQEEQEVKQFAAEHPEEVIELPKSKSQTKREAIVEAELAQDRALRDAAMDTFSPEPGSRHWHRVDSRKAEDAIKTWYEKGVLMGLFTCNCGKEVTRMVQR